MAHIEWKDRYNINYKEIDTQHKGLVAILNRMIDLLDQGPDAEEIAEIFHRLCQYALTHCKTEGYMEAAAYPSLERHKAEHGPFIDQLLALDQAQGLLDTPEFLAQASELCGCPLTESDFREALAEACTPNEAICSLIRQLNPRYRLALCADTTPWAFEQVL